MADEHEHHLDIYSPDPGDWIELYQNHGEEVAVTALYQLILDFLCDASNESVGEDFEFGKSADSKQFKIFLNKLVSNVSFDNDTLRENGEKFCEFMEEISKRSNNFTWMPLMSTAFRALTVNETVFFIAKPIVHWYMALLRIQWLPGRNQTFLRIAKRTRDHLIETIAEHLNSYGAFLIMVSYFTHWLPVMWGSAEHDERGIVSICRRFITVEADDVLLPVLKCILKMCDRDYNLLNQFSTKDFCDALSDVFVKQFQTKTLQQAYTLAIEIQKHHPQQALFKSQVFDDIIRQETSSTLRKLSTELLHTTFAEPDDPNSIKFLACVTNLLIREKQFDEEITSAVVLLLWEYEELTNWSKVFHVTQRYANRPQFLGYFWEFLMKPTLNIIDIQDAGNSVQVKRSFMQHCIQFLVQFTLNEEPAHKLVYGLVNRFMFHADKQLQLLDDAHCRTLAAFYMQAFVNRRCSDFTDEEKVFALIDVLINRGFIERHNITRVIDDFLAENCTRQAATLLENPNHNFEHDHRDLQDKFVILAAMAMQRMLEHHVFTLNLVTYGLLNGSEMDLNRNRDFWAYVLTIFTSSCMGICLHRKEALDINIDLPATVEVFLAILPTLNQQLDLFCVTLFNTLCRMFMYKFCPIPQYAMATLVAFLDDKVELYIINSQNSPNFRFKELGKMFNLFGQVLKVHPNPQVEHLIVKAFKAFRDETVNFNLLKVLAYRQPSTIFSECVMAVFSSYPTIPRMKSFAQGVKAMIEEIPEPQRKVAKKAVRNSAMNRFSKAQIRLLDAGQKKKAQTASELILENILKS